MSDTSPKYLFFDTETTDLVNRDLIQLAMIDENDFLFDQMYKPLSDIDFMSMSIHNITPEMLEDKPSFDTALVPDDVKNKFPEVTTTRELLELLSKEYVWVAHNVEFDISVLSKLGITIPKTICTLKVARYYLKEGYNDLPSYKLQYLRYMLGLYKMENQDHLIAHDALSDVFFLRDLFNYLLNNVETTMEEMLRISEDPQILRSFTFGKYAGQTIKDVMLQEPSYLDWAVTTLTDKPDLIWNIKRVQEGKFI